MGWAQTADKVVADLASSGRQFTADDLLDITGPPDLKHTANGANNAVGAVFSRACKAGLITVVGHATSKTPTRKGGLIRVWQGVDRSDELSLI